MLLHSRGQNSEPEITDLNALVREAVHLAYHGQRAHDTSFNITLEEEYDAGVGQVRVLPHEISRVILNLANNACYAANQKARRLNHGANGEFSPTLRVLTQAQDEGIKIRVRDNGNGIPDAASKNIFTPFFTTKPTGEGTGLGLSMSYDIVVHQHGGAPAWWCTTMAATCVSTAGPVNGRNSWSVCRTRKCAPHKDSLCRGFNYAF